MKAKTRRTTKKRAPAKAGRVQGEWGVVYRKTGHKVPKTSVYGLGSHARTRASAAAKSHNTRR